MDAIKLQENKRDHPMMKACVSKSGKKA